MFLKAGSDVAKDSESQDVLIDSLRKQVELE
jgi:hypothetical protein